MKKTLLSLLVFVPFWSTAQRNTVASGATAIGTTGTVTFSVGQLDYQTHNGSTGTITQGVQQPFEINPLAMDEVPQTQLTAMVYPNPTVHNVTLLIKEYDFTNLEYLLIDVQGRIISKEKITQNETQINMAWLASAQYYLYLTEGAKKIKSFKIIKN